MSDDSYTASFVTDKSPDAVFEAVTNVRGWWSGDIEGNTKNQDDEFIFEVPGVHRSVQKLVEVIPGKRVVWLITEAEMTFIKQRDEWKGTKIIFDILEENGKTRLTFTHEGLKPEIECYKFCMPSWEQYVKGSLKQLVETGEGTPNLEGKTIDKPDEA